MCTPNWWVVSLFGNRYFTNSTIFSEIYRVHTHASILSSGVVSSKPAVGHSGSAATWVTPLKAWEKHLHKNHCFCSNFATSRKVQHTVASPLHGGGSGFESPRLHS